MRRLAAAGLALAALAACSRVGSPNEGARRASTVPHVLRIGQYQDIVTLNPHLSASTALADLSQLTMAYLVRYDRHNQPVPELAVTVPTQANGGISRDGTTIVWHLRRGVRWSDGAPFDADDVVFSTRVVQNPRNNEVGRDGWDLIAAVDEPDKYTVAFHLRRPYSGYLPTFFGSAGANPCILPKHLLAGLPDINNASYNSKPVGIGPFRYVRWRRGDAVELEPNPYYWRGKPKLTRILERFVPDRNTLLTELRSGEIDLWPSFGAGYLDRITTLPNVRTYRRPGYYYAHVTFNVSRPPVADEVVRRALRLATNRPELVAKVNFHSGVVQENQITPVSTLYAPIPLVPFDLAQANRLLDEAGWRRGADGVRAKNGVRLALTWAATTGTPDVDRLIESVRATWSQVGVALAVHRYAPALFFGPYAAGGVLFTGKFDVTSFSWGETPDADYSATAACADVPPGGENISRICDPRMDALLERAQRAYDEAQRRPVLRLLAERVSALVPYYVLYISENLDAASVDLRNWQPNAVTPFDDFLDVDI